MSSIIYLLNVFRLIMADNSVPRLPSMQAPKHKACHDEWDQDCKIFVGGLGEEGTRLELDEAFSKFGPIKNIWLAKAPPSFAYIEMAVSVMTIANCLQSVPNRMIRMKNRISRMKTFPGPS